MDEQLQEHMSAAMTSVDALSTLKACERCARHTTHQAVVWSRLRTPLRAKTSKVKTKSPSSRIVWACVRCKSH